ncbi:MAG TPA: hypothetical protein VGL81_01725 [Polyangiaceae bacterium]|jgi:hypothetical protein
MRTPSFLSRTRTPLTLFTFGYWGNGAATAELAKAVDAAERQRGFDPPLWVDIRIQRSVRAVGFRDDAFERLLGDRYMWLPDLGNASIQDGGRAIRIKNPAAAADLLELAIERPARRVIFFCACLHPAGCHRRVVATLVVRAARARGGVTIVEWPGGEPRALAVEVGPAAFRKVARGAKTMPVPAGMNMGEAAALPWGSKIVLRSAGEETAVLVGPTRFDAHGAHLPILPSEGDRTTVEMEAASRRYRVEYGYGAMS